MGRITECQMWYESALVDTHTHSNLHTHIHIHIRVSA